tara:strand:- start:229 stop:1095 length:867 start_codon:yes stop_codon:yes gene_type:complete
MKNINFSITILFLLAPFYSYSGLADLGGENWKPQIVEKMYVLPPQHLNKVLNNDFNKSILAINLQNKDNKIKNKIDKINELNSLLPRASQEENLEIKHQIIINKRDYIKDMNDLLEMKKQKLVTKKKIFNKIKKRIDLKSLNSKHNNAFLENRQDAIKRAQKLDFKILESTSYNTSKKSKYFEKYQVNKNAINALKLAIEKHPMNNQNILSKDPKSKIEALRSYIHNIQTEIAVLEMKEQIINYMAKIVALDAMQLAEKVSEINVNDVNTNPSDINDPTNVINIFTKS